MSYKITNQKELRRQFFLMCRECPCESCTFKANGMVKSRFNLDANMCFNDWKDGLNRDRTISDELCFRAILF